MTDAQKAALTDKEYQNYLDLKANIDRHFLDKLGVKTIEIMADDIAVALADARIESEARRKVIMRSLSFIKSHRDCYHFNQLINDLDALAKEE